MVHVWQYTKKQRKRDMKKLSDPLKKLLKNDRKHNAELRKEAFKGI